MPLWLAVNPQEIECVISAAEDCQILQTDESQALWGARINSGWPPVTADCPSWTTGYHREDWERQGLLLWDHEGRTLTAISATFTLELLNKRRTTSEWKEHGLAVGQPVARIRLADPEHKVEQVLANEMVLCPGRLQIVLELLEAHEAELQKLREQEQEERRRRITEAYDIILDFGRRHGPTSWSSEKPLSK